MPTTERFWLNVDKGGAGGCWIWSGYRDRNEYGVFVVCEHGKPRKHYAHRFSWELVNGPIPEGLYGLHRCDNPPCVNPGHIFIGTHQDNMDDMAAKGRRRPDQYTTHCLRGHERTPENTYIWRGRRNCRLCIKIRDQARGAA